MKRITLYALAVVALLTLPSCRFITLSDELAKDINTEINGTDSGERLTASDNFITREDVTGDFHSITSNLPAEIIYTPGDCGVTLYGPDNVLDLITVTNENGRLNIKVSNQRIRNLKKLVVNVSSPVLEELTINGASDFKAPQGVTALDFKLTVNGAGDIEIKGLKADSVKCSVNGAGDADIHSLDCEQLNLSINGAGDATLSGKAVSADLSISGAGNIDAKDLDCNDIKTRVRGIGSISKPKNN